MSFYEDEFGDGAACKSGGLNFFSFFFTQLPVNGQKLGTITEADIMVRPSIFGIGLDFYGTTPTVFNREITNPERYYISYVVDPPPIVAGDEMRLDPPTGPITVSRWTCPDTNGFNNATNVSNTLNLLNTSSYGDTTFQCLDGSNPYFLQVDTSSAAALEDSVTFDQLAVSVVVRMVIDLRPGTIKGLDGIVALNHVVPEPGAFLPLAAGVLGIGFYVRRRRATQKAKMLNS